MMIPHPTTLHFKIEFVFGLYVIHLLHPFFLIIENNYRNHGKKLIFSDNKIGINKVTLARIYFSNNVGYQKKFSFSRDIKIHKFVMIN